MRSIFLKNHFSEETGMKKTFLTAVAVMVTTFFVGTTIAEAAGVTFGGQVRTRYEIDERDFNDATRPSDSVMARVRLNAKADILPDLSAFIQLQSARTWGVTANTTNSDNFAPSEGDNSVGIHQAFITAKNFGGVPADLKLGRQQIVIDGHRLFGHTGWTTGAQTHDAVRLIHKEGNHTIGYFYARVTDDGGTNDQLEVDVQALHANFKGILGGGLSLYAIFVDDDCSSSSGVTSTCLNTQAAPLNNGHITLGLRQAGQVAGIDYRGEFYFQTGDAEGDATRVGGYTTVNDVDREAYMVGLRVGKKFNSVMWKPKLTLWYDYLSGTSDADRASGDFKTFNTLFDTGHKFYGFMDRFLNAQNHGTKNLGLVDYAVKFAVSPAAKWTVKADWHWFQTAEGIDANPGLAGSGADRFDGNDLGYELDLTVVHKYSSNMTVAMGYSQFGNESGYVTLKGGGRDVGRWGYLQVDVKF